MYYNPKFSSLLNEYVEVNINLVAEAIARNYGWTFALSSETLLNLLRMSTQAIKTIGKEKINDYIYIIRNRLTEEDKQVAFEETKRTTALVYEVIKKICK